MRKITSRLGLLLLGLVLAVGFTELALRSLGVGQSVAEILESIPSMFLSSSVLPFALQPHFQGRHRTPEFDVGISLNSHGYRTPEFLVKKAEQFRLLCVGDSFTFGHGVEQEQAWPRVLETHLTEDFASTGIEVINAGYQGCWYPDGYLLYLSRSGFRLEPDLVLIGFFMGNDLDYWPLPPRTQDRWRTVDAEGLPASIDSGKRVWRGLYVNRPPRLSGYPLLRDSRAAQMAVQQLRRRRVVGNAFPPEKMLESNIYRVPWSPRVEEKYRVLEMIFEAVRDRARQHNTRIAVVVFPELRQMTASVEQPELDLDFPQQQMVEMFQRLDIPCLDLLSTFREEGGESLYYAIDQHWTPAGNELAARSIADFVRSLTEGHRSADRTTPANYP